MLGTMPLYNKMKPLTAKQMVRLEKKKKKMAGFLEIVKLNDKDREIRLAQTREEDSDSSFCSEPEPKRLKINGNSESLPEIKENEVYKQVEQKESVSTHMANTRSGKPMLIGEEYMQLKKELKERKTQYQKTPKLRLKTVGEKASLQLDANERIPIFLSDIQHFLLAAQLGHHSPYSPSRWCQIEKYNRITHTVVLVIENISLYHYSSYESMFPFLNDTFVNKLELITPVAYEGNMIRELVAVPLTGTHKNKLIRKFGSLDAAMQITGEMFHMLRAIFPISYQPPLRDRIECLLLPASDKFPRTSLLLSAWQLVEENYPIPLKGELSNRYADYVLTKDAYDSVTPFSPMFGLDCEMCRTTSGNLELTRISVVDENMKSIYERLVKPDNTITDYLTRFSGITKQMLEGVTTKLSDVQQDLRKLLPSDAILVGQSLNFDLHTLKMMHPYVIDTSVIFNISGDRTKKTKLQTLAREFLSERIQQGRAGHCSVEDSSASLKLAQLKLTKYVEYGDAVMSGKTDFEKNFARLSEKEYATSLFKHLTVENEKKAVIIGCSNVIGEYSTMVTKSHLDNDADHKNKKVICETVDSNKAVVKRLTETSMGHSFSLGHISLSDDQVNHDNALKTFRNINKWVSKIWNNMSVHGLCVILFSGQRQGSSGVGFLQLKKEPRA